MQRAALRQEATRAEPGAGTRADQNGACAAVRHAHVGRVAGGCDRLARVDKAKEAEHEDSEAHLA